MLNEISQIQENVLCDDMCIKFQNRQDKSMVTGAGIMVPWGLEETKLFPVSPISVPLSLAASIAA